jgi:long-chain fatty acid transport protein
MRDWNESSGQAQGRAAASRSLAMNRLMRILLVFALLSGVMPAVAHATNGLNLIGSGGVSSALAGADTALATDFSAMNTNPAGMVQIRGQHAGITVGMLRPELMQKDVLNQGVPGQNNPLVIPNLGYIKHLTETRFTVGVGFFTIGGNVSDFRALQTTLGTTDKMSTQLRHYKFTPSIAYEVTDKLSIGAALAVSYVDLSLKFFPNSLTGFETTASCDGANGLNPPGVCAFDVAFVPKFGVMYRPNEQFTFGIAYTMKANLSIDEGQITRNQPGIGKVTYDSKASGLKWPDDIAVGLAWRPRKDWLIAGKFQWINWNAALNNVQVSLYNGDNAAMPTDSINLEYKWRDQYVAALGINHDLTEKFSLRGGYNFGNNPVPGSTMSPVNANIVEHHIVGGGQYRFSEALSFDGVFNYAVKSQRTYTNPAAALPGNSTIQVGGYEVIATLSYWR